MDLEALGTSPVGSLVPVTFVDGQRTVEYFAFQPDALPIKVTLSGPTWARIVEASVALGRLDASARQLPNPGLLRRSMLQREAQSTSAIEGTYAAFTEILEANLDDEAGRTPEVREILNYVRAADQGYEWVADRPVTIGLLEGLQRILVTGTTGDRFDPGQLRTRPVRIGSRHGSIDTARFIPPPPGDALKHGLEQWLNWTGQAHSEIPPVVAAALAHYQFETLHPFADGNGRLGRLLIVLQLMRATALTHPVLIVSPWFERNRREYQDHLLAVSCSGDWDPWVQFFAEGLAVQAADTEARIADILDYAAEARSTLAENGVSGLASRIVEDLAGWPVLTVQRMADVHEVTFAGANKAVKRLADLGILREATGGKYGRVFVCDYVLNALERD